MKKSYWVIFGIVLFILILIVALAIFLISNKSDALSENQEEMAKEPHSTDMLSFIANPSCSARPQVSHPLVRL